MLETGWGQLEKKVDFQYVNILRLTLQNTDKQNTSLGLKGHNKFWITIP